MAEDTFASAYKTFRDLTHDDSPGLQPESTWSRARLEIDCSGLASDIELAALSDEALAVFWRLMPYAAWGLPDDPVVMGRMARVSPRRVSRLWPKLEPFFVRCNEGWRLAPNKWAQPYVATPRKDRVPLRHLFRRLTAFWGRACVYCGNVVDRLAIEHIVPKARGGNDELCNLTLACRRCNSKKGTMTAAEFGHPHVHEKAQRIQ